MDSKILVNTLLYKWTYNTAVAEYPLIAELTTKEKFLNWRFEIISREKHGNKYDYSRVQYKNKVEKVEIICPTHGVFTQSPKEHSTKGHGCNKCGTDRTRTPLTEFISRANEIHNNKYLYDKVDLSNGQNYKTTITCKIHGDFRQTPASHLTGHGCAKCAGVAKSSTEEFIQRAKDLYGDSFDYSETDNYTGNKDLILVKCTVCNRDSAVLPNNHLRGHGCYWCSLSEKTSKAEREIKEFISSNGFSTEVRKLPSGKHIDIFIPEINLAIEYNGIYWHSADKKPKDYHLNKTEECLSLGWDLLHIWEDDWLNKKELIIGIISSKLSLNNRIYARTLEVRTVETAESREFFNKNHIQGFVNSIKETMGLFTPDGRLVMALGYGSARFNRTEDIEILRVASSIGTSVPGGFSRLIKRLPENQSVMSYCRRDYGTGKAYLASGFSLVEKTTPDYWYTNPKGDKISRYKAMKHKLSSFLPRFNAELTEEENMKNHGYFKIYGCGNLVFRLET